MTGVLAWIVGFFVGEGLAYLSGWQNEVVYSLRYWLVSFGAATAWGLFFLKRTQLAHYAVTLSALAWGFGNFAKPSTNVQGAHAVIVGHEYFSYGQRQAHISVGDGHIYRLYSRLHVGERGRVACVAFRGRQALCSLRSSYSRGVRAPSPLAASVSSWHDWFSRRINVFPEGVRAWLNLLVLGDTKFLSLEEKDAYKHCGLFHLLVISGFHISLIGGLCLDVCFKGASILYAVKLIDARWFLFLQTALRLLAAFLALSFGLCVGMSPASQRASLAFACIQFCSVMTPQLCRFSLLCLIAALQISLFPIGFFSAGNIMSWFGYALLSGQSGDPCFRLMMKTQVAMFLATVVLFQQWAPLGLFLNWVLGDLFNGIIILGVLCFLFGDRLPFLPTILDQLFSDFSACLVTISHAFPIHDYLDKQLPPSDLLIKSSCVFLVFYLLKSFSYLGSEAKIMMHALIRIYYGRYLERPQYHSR